MCRSSVGHAQFQPVVIGQPLVDDPLPLNQQHDDQQNRRRRQRRSRRSGPRIAQQRAGRSKRHQPPLMGRQAQLIDDEQALSLAVVLGDISETRAPRRPDIGGDRLGIKRRFTIAPLRLDTRGIGRTERR
jgi:hypothetical protein